MPYQVNTPIDTEEGETAQQGDVRPADAPLSPQGDVVSTDAPLSQTRQVIDDDHLKKMMRNQRLNTFKRNRFRIVTLILIAINVVVFVVEVALSGFHADRSTLSLVNTSTLLQMGAMYAPFVQGVSDFYRFVMPMFLHINILHLGFNMLALYSVGDMLERTLGRGNFIALYFIGGITGNAVSYAYSMYTGSFVVSAGASTSVFALFVAVALLGLMHRTNRRLYSQYSKGMIGIIVVNIVYTLIVPGISISGHLGGALGGLIAMFMLPAKNLRVARGVRIVVAVLWVAALVWLIGALVFGVFPSGLPYTSAMLARG